MRVTRVHVDAELAPGTELALPAAAATHLLRVLRLQSGDACTLFNGDGCDYRARILAATRRELRVRIETAEQLDNESPLRLTLLQGIARGDRMDWILQKATELGAAAFIPVSSERSEVRLEGERADKRLAHWRSVVIAACEQSGRARVPAVAAPRPLDQGLARLPSSARFLLDPGASESIARASAESVGDCVLAIGPEGGWSQRDRELLREGGFGSLRLGPRILRTETAGIAAVAALQSRWGDLG